MLGLLSRSGAVAGAAVMLLLAAACGGDDDDPSVPASSGDGSATIAATSASGSATSASGSAAVRCPAAGQAAGTPADAALRAACALADSQKRSLQFKAPVIVTPGETQATVLVKADEKECPRECPREVGATFEVFRNSQQQWAIRSQPSGFEETKESLTAKARAVEANCLLKAADVAALGVKYGNTRAHTDNNAKLSDNRGCWWNEEPATAPYMIELFVAPPGMNINPGPSNVASCPGYHMLQMSKFGTEAAGWAYKFASECSKGSSAFEPYAFTLVAKKNGTTIRLQGSLSKDVPDSAILALFDKAYQAAK